MARNLTVRRYRPSDADGVWTVHERALRASPLEFVEGLDDDLTNVSGEYLESGGEFFVGLVDDEIVAIGGFRPRENDAAEIRRMRVRLDHQRNGYGERILEELEARAREEGFARVVLHTNERLAAARRLYETRGYEETRRETHPTGDELIHYEKYLSTSHG